ncbi:MAG: L-threonylcarbamoyladenylate synthase [Candidatus Omnitrophota bacterium]|jgi:tRNA threonylcarbamoyl adenosine modification protein (Sua5/YciO/YrdC/YwlC family)
MRTRILKINPQQPEEGKIKIAAKALRNGGLVIIPTETVYGVAADLRKLKAIDQLHKIKQRPKDKPFSLHIDDKERAEDFTNCLNKLACKLIDKFWPGPLTLILPGASGGTVGLRVPDNNIALKLIAAVGGPLLLPSANLSGRPAPKNFDEAMRDLGDKVDIAIDGGSARIGIESSVVDLTQTPYRIQRLGALSKEEIDETAQKKIVFFVCTGNSCRSVMAKAFLEKRLKEIKRNDVQVISAGTLGLSNLGASVETKQILEKEGMDVGAHISSMVTSLMIKKSDIILVMEKMHEEKILAMVPEAKTKLFLLKEFAKIEDGLLDIQDPIGRLLEFHEYTFSIIKQAVERIIKLL